jgi:hypothetical protein
MAWKRNVASLLPGLLLVATLVDDPVFGSAIAGLQLAMGPIGVIVATVSFTAFSVIASMSTLWAIRTAPMRVSDRLNQRLERVRQTRVGSRIAAIDDHHLMTTMLVAAVLGSVAPVILASIGTEPRRVGVRTALVAGVAYGLVFSSGYGLVGTLIDNFI